MKTDQPRNLHIVFSSGDFVSATWDGTSFRLLAETQISEAEWRQLLNELAEFTDRLNGD